MFKRALKLTLIGLLLLTLSGCSSSNSQRQTSQSSTNSPVKQNQPKNIFTAKVGLTQAVELFNQKQPNATLLQVTLQQEHHTYTYHLIGRVHQRFIKMTVSAMQPNTAKVTHQASSSTLKNAEPLNLTGVKSLKIMNMIAHNQVKDGKLLRYTLGKANSVTYYDLTLKSPSVGTVQLRLDAKAGDILQRNQLH
ncbi:hypothetical protein BSQ39_03810 [Loigolactobacillus backii]|uniref:PepSY domain-containing protein n=2 Tax=Loigolactobacillus backii TaxID=375175 RepID=A0A192H275_9LACO|nr:hypothetical protein AYR52_08190 [Loigolactobacillus backii]ANK62337.1 hypothetical protein AYR53_05800 [Loigolactobacillus backii]ANK65103.1 hypothetical protein AYR54_07600 [Loigolactobacillus backii]ANK67662.1 hypothetical protein AYR55_08205 [Loigolactobacillus backii]ANK70650.1 hypothetical protein AYR56_11190 [Loigolactobacillus backii]